jgi:NAD(P)-dependent dehydrogenase (short-subunit alcohol dehydrogenase family)
MAETVLITGANRGIGLAVTRIFLANGDRVFTACRQPQKSTELTTLKEKYPQTLEIVALDVNLDESAVTAAQEVSKKTDRLDVLINMAGILPQPYNPTLEKMDIQQLRDAFETNVLGPIRVSRSVLALLRKGNNPRVINVSSGAGMISSKATSEFYTYGPTKAALNYVTRGEAFEFKKEGITFVALDPGWVKTDMGGPYAPLTPEESATAIVKTVKGLTIKKTSLFISREGKELEW